MISLIASVHIFVAILLIFFVLIQDSKGAMGGMMGGGGGGGSNTLFGATGAASFIVKMTRLVAIIFAATCIGLTILSTGGSSSVVDGFVPPAQEKAVEGKATETEKKETNSK